MHPRHGHRAVSPSPASTPPPHLAPAELACEHTGLQQVRIARHPVFGGQLFLDGDLQISESDSAYGIAMASPLLGLSRLSRVAILGGGDGGVASELLRSVEPLAHAPRITMVEIDARVVALCREHLPALWGDAHAHPQLDLVIGDALAWIAQARGLDAVVYDLTMDPVRDGQSRADFVSGIVSRVARALRPGGVFSMQCCGHGREDAQDRAHRRALLPIIRQAVDAHLVDRCEQDVLVPSYRDLWTFLSARKPA